MTTGPGLEQGMYVVDRDFSSLVLPHRLVLSFSVLHTGVLAGLEMRTTLR